MLCEESRVWAMRFFITKKASCEALFGGFMVVSVELKHLC